MTTVTVTPILPAAVRRIGTDTRYVLLGFPLSLITLALFAVGLSLGLGTSILVVGLPIMAGTLAIARITATAERHRAAEVLGHPLPRPVSHRRPAPAGAVARMWHSLGDGQSWLDLAHGLLRIIPSTIGFAVVVTWWAGALGGLSAPLWDWSIPRPAGSADLPELLGLGAGAEARIWFHMACGLFFALTLAPVVRAAAALEAGFARTLLSAGERPF